MTPILDVRAVGKWFRIPRVRRDTVREHALDLFRPRPSDELRVLESVTFAVERGETIGLMGRNGSGKSTLLKIIAGVYQADRGTVILRGAVTPILELGVGWNPELDAIDNILLIGSVMGLSLRELTAATDEILAFAELERFANLKLQHYSSGMASRLAYAVAFQAVREILLVDEVLVIGDAGFRARCEARFRQLRRAGHTLLVVSHDPHIIATFSDRALLLEGGRIVREDSGPAVAADYVARLTGDGAGLAPAAASDTGAGRDLA